MITVHKRLAKDIEKIPADAPYVMQAYTIIVEALLTLIPEDRVMESDKWDIHSFAIIDLAAEMRRTGKDYLKILEVARSIVTFSEDGQGADGESGEYMSPAALARMKATMEQLG